MEVWSERRRLTILSTRAADFGAESRMVGGSCGTRNGIAARWIRDGNARRMIIVFWRTEPVSCEIHAGDLRFPRGYARDNGSSDFRSHFGSSMLKVSGKALKPPFKHPSSPSSLFKRPPSSPSSSLEASLQKPFKPLKPPFKPLKPPFSFPLKPLNLLQLPLQSR